jgi:hypothetical protein
MKRKLQALFLLFITLPYIFPLPQAEPNALYATEVDGPYQGGIPQILAIEADILCLFTQPEKTSKTILPIKFIHMTNQMTLEKSIWQSEINYSENNDLHIYYPLIVYKISLSAHTSDG